MSRWPSLVDPAWLEHAVRTTWMVANEPAVSTIDDWCTALDQLMKPNTSAESAVLRGLLVIVQLDLARKSRISTERILALGNPLLVDATADPMEAFTSWLKREFIPESLPTADRVRQILDSSFTASLTARELGNRIGQPPWTIHRAFRRRFGLSMKTYLSTVRLNEAIRLLTDTDTKIEAISLMVGLHSKTNLYRLIRRVTGMTPREVRHACHAATSPRRILATEIPGAHLLSGIRTRGFGSQAPLDVTRLTAADRIVVQRGD